MRTTLTLDDDIAAKLKTEARRSGRAFKEVVNDLLRRALNARAVQPKPQRFVVRARDMGLLPGLTFDHVEELIERLEDVEHP